MIQATICFYFILIEPKAEETPAVTEEPKTEEPKTEEPKTEEATPKEEEPKSEEATPNEEEPKTEEATAEVTEEPKTEETPAAEGIMIDMLCVLYSVINRNFYTGSSNACLLYIFKVLINSLHSFHIYFYYVHIAKEEEPKAKPAKPPVDRKVVHEGNVQRKGENNVLYQ